MDSNGVSRTAQPQPGAGPAPERVRIPGTESRSTSKVARAGLMAAPTEVASVAASTEVASVAASTEVAPVGHRPHRQLAARLGRRLVNPVQWSRIRLLTDAVVLYIASGMALLADAQVRSIASNRLIALAFPIVVIVMMRARRTPDERLNVSRLDVFAYVLGVVSLAAMLVISFDSILGEANPLALAPRLWLFAFVYLGVARAMLVSVRSQAMRSPAVATPTLIVGAGMIGAHLVKRLLGEPGYGLLPVAFLDSDPLPTLPVPDGPPVPVLGGPDDLAEAIASTGAQHVILAFSAEPDHVLVAKVRECQALGVEVSLVPRLYESINERTTLDHVGGLPLLTLHTVDPRGWQFAVKHFLDRTFAALALLVGAPVMTAIAIAVRGSSPGPILFRQRRVGRDGREFTMLKFRTMRGHPSTAGEADAGWAASILEAPEPAGADPAPAPSASVEVDRVTRVGRFLRTYSLDELPQLVNVLRGDMSLVGPRPERVAYARDFERLVARYTDRHRVKSGLTGWAQVNGLRGQTSIDDRVEWDNYYILNWSLRLDLRILAMTVAEVFRFRESDS